MHDRSSRSHAIVTISFTQVRVESLVLTYSTTYITIHSILLYKLHYYSPSFAMHHLLQKSLHCNKTFNYNTSLIEIHPTLQYTLYYIHIPPHYYILTLQFTPHWNTPYISIHLMLHCIPHNNTPQHYNKPYITLIGLHIMIHPYNTSIPPCYKAPNITIHPTIQYT